MRILVSLLIFGSFTSQSCQIDTRGFAELVDEANHIFIGSVVEIHWANFEKHVQKNPPIGDVVLMSTNNDEYVYRAIVHESWKGKLPQKAQLRGGHCRGAHVNGGQTYLIMTFGNGQVLDSEVFPLRSDILRDVKALTETTRQ